MRRAQRQKTEPSSRLISMELTVSLPEYLNIECWKFDSDQFSSFWDIVGKFEVGAHLFKQARLLAKYGILIDYTSSFTPSSTQILLNHLPCVGVHCHLFQCRAGGKLPMNSWRGSPGRGSFCMYFRELLSMQPLIWQSLMSRSLIMMSTFSFDICSKTKDWHFPF